MQNAWACRVEYRWIFAPNFLAIVFWATGRHCVLPASSSLSRDPACEF